MPRCTADCKSSCCANGQLPPIAGNLFRSLLNVLKDHVHITPGTRTRLAKWSRAGSWVENIALAYGALIYDKLFRQSLFFRLLFHSGPRISLGEDPVVLTHLLGNPEAQAAANQHCGRDFTASKTDIHFLDFEIFYGHKPDCYRCGAAVVREGWCKDAKRVAGPPNGRQLFVLSSLYRCECCCGDEGKLLFSVVCSSSMSGMLLGCIIRCYSSGWPCC